MSNPHLDVIIAFCIVAIIISVIAIGFVVSFLIYFKSKKKKETPESKTILVSELIIHLNEKQHYHDFYSKCLVFERKIEKTNHIYPPWYKFIKWYHRRPQSTCFTFRTKRGLSHVKREHIDGYSIQIIKRKV